MEDGKLNVQWFPGHMAKTRRQIKESLPLVDAVVEIADARVPQSSRNPELGELIGDKPLILILNKCDLADQETIEMVKEDVVSYSGVRPVVCMSAQQGLSEEDVQAILG